jgi:hypothetical protein
MCPPPLGLQPQHNDRSQQQKRKSRASESRQSGCERAPHIVMIHPIGADTPFPLLHAATGCSGRTRSVTLRVEVAMNETELPNHLSFPTFHPAA